MQDISGLPEEGQQLVNSYGDMGFRISGVRHEGSVLVFPNRTESWDVTTAETVTVESLSSVGDQDPGIEILLIGCGASMAFIEDDVRRALRDKGVVIDAMDTGAAVRTYNVLLLEGRRVAAALIAV
ncbi:Mth938-like domain-containing protein [Sneathiella chinensis]|uniref:NADH dehydrogenase [ubiquinone] 1 alpha subcomplex assembly factor 3 n=1 Tax=Sneathiella chinensis TaxID=349750 RepID=A0ABQ5U7S2_9PROT|nr:Mth938-like domain-containing protein [Sneathiella chinensis]GLQ07461.1 hypothetical protein GCM10007924_26820 [Sneathiella chinensis]